MKAFLAALLVMLANYAYSQAALDNLNRELIAAMREVPGVKFTTSQTMKTAGPPSYLLAFETTVTDTKGKSTNEKYLFNLADIDQNTLRIADSKEALRIQMKCQKGQKFIRRYKEGEFLEYTASFIILGLDIDNAREIERILKEAIPQAVQSWENDANIANLSPENMILKLYSTVGTVAVESNTYKQSLGKNGDHPDRMKLVVEPSGGKSGGTTTYVFSPGDLQPNSVKLVVAGKEARVEASTKNNLGWIATEVNGKRGDLAKEISIRVTDPDQGKIVAALLEKIVPYGETQINNRLPQVKDQSDAFSRMAGVLEKFDAEGALYEYQFDKKAQTKLGFTKGSMAYEYFFHFGDLNPKSVKLSTKGELAQVSVSTQGNANYIWVAENGAQQNYDNGLTFYFADVEKARLAEKVLPALIEKCATQPAAGDLAQLKQMLSEGQTLESLESCKWKFTQREGEVDNQYEFNLFDINAAQVDIKVSGKNVTLLLQTNGKQNIITSMVKEKPGFTNALTLRVGGIPEAKIAKATLEKLLAECKK